MKTSSVMLFGFVFLMLAGSAIAFSANAADVKAIENTKSPDAKGQNIESSNRDHFDQDAQSDAAKLKTPSPTNATVKTDGGPLQGKQKVKQ